MKRALIIVGALLFLMPSLFAATSTKAITFDDFIRIRRLSDVQISPDGSLIAFVVTEMDKEANRPNSDIWVVSSTGGNLRQLTFSPKADYCPRWSPDGEKLAFISARGGMPQVYLMSLSGGEAYPVTNLSTGASSVIWSPKGTYLAFTSRVYPDCADDDCNKKKNEEQEKSIIKARIYDHLLYRHISSWWDGTRNHVFIVPVQGGNAVDISPGDYDTPPSALGSSGDFNFSPDETEVCFVRNTDLELKLSLGTNNDLFLASVNGSGIKPITTNRANDNSPKYSPDGRYIAYRAMARPGHEADKYSLILYDRKTQDRMSLSENLDRSVGEAVWAIDSSAIYFGVEENARTAVFMLTIKDKKLEKLIEGHFLSSLNLVPDGKRMIFLKQSTNRPPDVYGFDLQTKEITQLTDINQHILSGLEMNPAEEFLFEGAAKEKIHGLLVKPPFFKTEKKYPLVILVHGGPQSAWNDDFHFRWNAQMFAAPGYVTAMINFHGSTGYGQKFTDSIRGDWGGKPYKDIMKGVDYILANYDFIDKEKLAAAGASYGGYMINWIEGQTDRFDCLVSHAGVFDLPSMYGATDELWFPEWEYLGTPWTSPEQYQKWSPSSNIRNFKTPCLVIHGQNDYRVPLSQALFFFTALQRMKVPSKFLYLPDESHTVQKPKNAELWWETILDWLAGYLK